MLGPAGLQIRQRAKGYDLPIRAPERSRQIEEGRVLWSVLDRLERQVAEKEAEIHRRIAEMSRFIIHEGKAPLVRENVLGTVIAVTQRCLQRQHAVDDRLDGGRDLGPPLLNATIKRIDAQLHKHSMIAEALDELRVSCRRLVHHAQDKPGALADGAIDLARKQGFLPHPGSRWRVAHREYVIGPVAEEDLRHGRLGQEGIEHLHDLLLAIDALQVAEPGVAGAKLRAGLFEDERLLRCMNPKHGIGDTPAQHLHLRRSLAKPTVGAQVIQSVVCV